MVDWRLTNRRLLSAPQIGAKIGRLEGAVRLCLGSQSSYGAHAARTRNPLRHCWLSYAKRDRRLDLVAEVLNELFNRGIHFPRPMISVLID